MTRTTTWRRALIGLALATMAAATAAADFASVKPAARVEHWQRRQAEIDAALKDTQALSAVKLVFVGDSITDFWLLDDNPWVKGQKYGRKVWDASFGGSIPANRALNIGISGDRLEHVLYRVQPRSAGGLGQLDAPALDPDFLIVMLGINNTWAAEEPVVDSVVEGVRAVLGALHERKPRARIVLQSLLPTSEDEKNAEVVRPVNQRLARMAQSPPFAAFTTYLDLYPAFVDRSGRQIAALFTDGLHPNDVGYRVWRDRLEPFLQAARESRAATGTAR
jgi:lysophospholipase L1-like esterase